MKALARDPEELQAHGADECPVHEAQGEKPDAKPPRDSIHGQF